MRPISQTHNPSFASTTISVPLPPSSSTPAPQALNAKMPRRLTNTLAHKLLPTILLASLFTATAHGAPLGSTTSAASSPSPTVPYASTDPNAELWGPDSDIIPEAQRGPYGATILGPQNVPLALQNPSLLAPPTTDHGSV